MLFLYQTPGHGEVGKHYQFSQLAYLQDLSERLAGLSITAPTTDHRRLGHRFLCRHLGHLGAPLVLGFGTHVLGSTDSEGIVFKMLMFPSFECALPQWCCNGFLQSLKMLRVLLAVPDTGAGGVVVEPFGPEALL